MRNVNRTRTERETFIAYAVVIFLLVSVVVLGVVTPAKAADENCTASSAGPTEMTIACTATPPNAGIWYQAEVIDEDGVKSPRFDVPGSVTVKRGTWKWVIWAIWNGGQKSKEDGVVNVNVEPEPTTTTTVPETTTTTGGSTTTTAPPSGSTTTTTPDETTTTTTPNETTSTTVPPVTTPSTLPFTDRAELGEMAIMAAIVIPLGIAFVVWGIRQGRRETNYFA